MTFASAPSPSPRRLRGVAAAISALAVTLAACGTSTGSATGPVTIRVANRATGSFESRSTAGVAAAPVPAVDSAIYPYPARTVTYAVQGTLPELGGDGPAWHYVAVPKVGAAQVTALAATLGVAGPVTETPADEGGGWHVGPIDGSGRSLVVQRDAVASWYLDGGVQERSPTAMCGYAAGPPTTMVEPSNGKARQPLPTLPDAPAPDAPTPEPPMPEPPTSMPECSPPEPPANVPSADAAMVKARALAAALGVSPAADRIEVSGDAYGRYVTWTTTLGGLANPDTWSVAYGAEGAVVSANGSLAVPEKAAAYPRIGTTKAIDRLKQGQGLPGGVWPAGAAIVGSGAAVEPASVVAAPNVARPPTTLLRPITTTGSVRPGVPTTVPAPASPATTATGLPPGVRSKAAPDAARRPTTTGAPAPSVATVPALTAAPAVSTGSAPVTSGPAVSTGPIVTTRPPATTVVPSAPVEVTVTITAVEPVLVALYAVDGDIWLVPAYRFTTSEGTVDVTAIDDAYVEQVTPDGGGLRPDDASTGRLQPGVGSGSGGATTGSGGVVPGPPQVTGTEPVGPVPTPAGAPPAPPGAQVGGPPTS